MEMRKRVLSLLAAVLTLGLPIVVTAVSAGSAAAATTPGSLDPAFGNGGKVLTNLGVPGVPSDAVLQSNGDFVISGSFGLARYLPSWRLDLTFGSGGLAQTGFTDFGFGPTGVAIQPDGKIVWLATRPPRSPAATLQTLPSPGSTRTAPSTPASAMAAR
jgi:hypothetical protein